MKRSSVLQDYKPHLEWIDPAEEKRKRRKKRIGLLTCLSLVAGWVFFSLNADLTGSSHEQQTVSSKELVLTPTTSKTLALTPNPISTTFSSTNKDKKVSKPVLTQTTPESETVKTSIPFEPLASDLAEQTQEANTIVDEEQVTSALAAIQETETPAPEKENWRTVTVKEGDNLSLIFSRLAINKNDLYQILSLGEETQSLKKLMPGQILKLKFDNDSKVSELIHESDLTHTLQVTRSEENFEAEIKKEQPETQIVSQAGTIQDSLFLSGQKAGLSDNIIMQIFDIFGWDIDFVLDIREGDGFRVVYEQLYKNGEYIKDGTILAAEFINQGKSFKAVRYVDADDKVAYYSENGNSMRKAFLRTPVNFTRISSHFNLKRKHPILNKIRAHKGVDYAAPSGTPVKSTGDGKVVFVGKKNGYGNTVIVEHGGKYTTLYAHLSRFSRGLKKGQRIEQGQTIAYVGQSGLATGPHLHYEFRVNGQHRNPLTVALPKSLPLPSSDLKLFKKQTKQALAKLDALAKATQQASLKKHKPEGVKLAASNNKKQSDSSLN